MSDSDNTELALPRVYLLAAITFLIYDHIITFTAEVDQIWRREFSIARVLFLLNRYSAILGCLSMVSTISLDASDVISLCDRYHHFPAALNSFNQLIIAALLLIRVYAIYKRQLWVFFIVVPLALATLGGSLVLAIGPEKFAFSDQCNPTSASAHGLLYMWLLPSAAFDLVVFLLTVYKTCQLNAELKADGGHSRLVELLMRDGSIFFAVMAASNLFNVVVIFKGGAVLSYASGSMGNNSVLTYTISVVMMSRLVLNLLAEGKSNLADPCPSLPPLVAAHGEYTARRESLDLHRSDDEENHLGGEV